MSNSFGRALTDWFQKNKRDLPWRHSRNPYNIWLSEIILQQTRVNQGLDYYLKFVREFPDVHSLALASKEKVYRLWQGLGYYNRADNLMKAAKIILENYNSRFPSTFEELKTLPGIGDYTAAAIASIAFNEKTPVVDGNVYRFLSRLYGIETPIQTGKAHKEFKSLAHELMADENPADFNQALMEFGALQCVPKSPNCSECIFNTQCFAFSKGKVSELPVKKNKVIVRNRYFYYFVIRQKDKNNEFYILRKRGDNDIWKNLYDFPSITLDKQLNDPLEALTLAKKEGWFTPENSTVGTPSTIYEHRLTHLKIEAVFIPVFSEKPLTPKEKNSLSLVSRSEINNYPVPQLIVRYFHDREINYLKR
ncbi:MAG: A/G-specific adenine glycosylase [Bacteroidales bacterium]|nr:A/G-specific adenine glycosylase [Bacteroidales bacterium]